MGATTKIQWADRSFQPWWGCTKVSPGCDHCYAEALAKRAGHDIWGDGKPRHFTRDEYWRAPDRWNAQAEKDRRRSSVFTSLLDPFEAREDLLQRRRAFANLISRTLALDWLLLTKRPENIGRLWIDPGYQTRNVWFGTTVELPEYVDTRVAAVLRHGASGARRFLSIEPLLASVASRLAPWLRRHAVGDAGDCASWCEACALRRRHGAPLDSMIDWIIVGGESGSGARPFEIGWAREIVALARACGVAVFVKQLGRYPLPQVAADQDGHRVYEWRSPNGLGMRLALKLVDRQGGDPAEWPEDLHVREFPRAS